MNIKLPEPFDCTILDELLESYTATTLPVGISEETSPKKALIARLLYWSAGVLRLNKIVVTPTFHLATNLGRPSELRIFLPYQSAPASVTTIQLLSQCYNKLIDSAVHESKNLDIKLLVTQTIQEIERAIQGMAEPGQNQPYFLQIAHTMGVPSKKVVRGVHVFGTGKHALTLSSTLTTHTSCIAVKCAKDKEITSRMLRDAGLPGTEHILIGSVEEAIQAAKKIGYPVVVKPADLDGGLGVFSNIVDEPMLIKMVKQSQQFSMRTLVEKHFFGNGHRLTIQNGQLVTATRKLAAGVEGDGVSTIRELVIAEQGRRVAARTAVSAYQNALQLDEEALDLLAQYKLDPSSIPKKGDYIILRRKNNAIAGGKTIPLKSDEIHPDNLQLCIHATEVMNLDIAGIDLLISDISVSWKKSGCLICEVNAQPQIGFGAAEIIMQRSFPAGSRIPAYLILNCSQRAVFTDKFLLNSAKDLGCNSASYKNGTWIDGVKIPARFNHSFDAARHVLFCKKTNAALCAMNWNESKQTGLPLDYFDKIILIHDDASRDLIKTMSEIIRNHTKEIELMNLAQIIN